MMFIQDGNYYNDRSGSVDRYVLAKSDRISHFELLKYTQFLQYRFFVVEI